MFNSLNVKSHTKLGGKQTYSWNAGLHDVICLHYLYDPLAKFGSVPVLYSVWTENDFYILK